MTPARQLALSFVAAAALIGGAAVAADGGRKLNANLRGSLEVPGPGDGDGRGSAMLTVNSGQRKVCYTLTARDIGTATAAHIHLGAAGVKGGVVAMLAAPASGRSTGCVTVSRALAQALIRRPGRYYVNVHTAAFPDGAIRGQLG